MRTNDEAIYKEHDVTVGVGQSILKDNLNYKNMQNGLLKLNWTNVKSALVYGSLWGLLSVFVQIQDAGSIYGLDWKGIINAGALSVLAVGVTLLRNLFTTNSGNFLGLIKVVPPVE